MKTRISITLSIASTALLLLVVAVQAQTTAPRPLLRVDVPFGFVAGGMDLPAGQYHVYHIMNSREILLRSSDGHATAVLFVHVSSTPLGKSSTKLVFNRYGEKYFLSQVWTAQDNEVHDCFKSSVEHPSHAAALSCPRWLRCARSPERSVTKPRMGESRKGNSNVFSALLFFFF